MIGPDLIPEWMSHGLCARIDPELWFPKKGGTMRAAKRICAECPVRVQCLEDALTQELCPSGIWGGVGEEELRKLRRQRREAA